MQCDFNPEKLSRGELLGNDTAPSKRFLCRIDANFNLEVLQTLPLPTDLVFVSGDISPDEQHLVLFGFGNTNAENIFALVDVQNGDYETQILPLQTTNPDQPYIFCANHVCWLLPRGGHLSAFFSQRNRNPINHLYLAARFFFVASDRARI